jgi:very-short-patch-repair endonuclease
MAATARKLDAVLAALAGRQHGVVTRQQLLAAGFSRHQVQRRIEAGALIPAYPGVYFVVHATSPLAAECAAVLACGPRALLSHRTAGRLRAWPVRHDGELHLTVVGRRPSARDGLRLHYLTGLDDCEIDRHQRLPISAPALTIMDIAGLGCVAELRACFNEARIQRVVTDQALRTAIARHPKRRGARALSALLGSERGPTITRSEAERVALRVMRKHGIEPDASDVRVGRYRVDFLFRAERLVVEVDGYRFHGTPHRFASDRRRIAALGAMGLQVHPLTWPDLNSRPAAAMADLAAALQQRRALLGLG